MLYMSKKKSNVIEDIFKFVFGVNILFALYRFSKDPQDYIIIVEQFIALSFAIIIGALIIIISIKKARQNKYLNSGINIVDKMEGKEFEKFLSAHFENLGYKVELTPDSNDYGADLVIKKDGIKTVLQAKRYKDKVGITAIQQIVAAINYYGADKGVVISNNFFTKNAYTLAKKNNVELWDRKKLIQIMSKSNGKVIADKVFNQSANDMICPKCGNKLVIRNGSRGKFIGCSNFPKCKYTRNIS